MCLSIFWSTCSWHVPLAFRKVQRPLLGGENAGWVHASRCFLGAVQWKRLSRHTMPACPGKYKPALCVCFQADKPALCVRFQAEWCATPCCTHVATQAAIS